MRGLVVGMFALLIAGTAQGGAVAYTENQAGGRIVITDQGYKGCKLAYTKDAHGESHTGCWRHDKTNIYIRWVDISQEVAYPLTAFRTIREVDL